MKVNLIGLHLLSGGVQRDTAAGQVSAGAAALPNPSSGRPAGAGGGARVPVHLRLPAVPSGGQQH